MYANNWPPLTLKYGSNLTKPTRTVYNKEANLRVTFYIANFNRVNFFEATYLKQRLTLLS